MGVKYIDDNTEEEIAGEPEMTVSFKGKTFHFSDETVEAILEESDTLSGVLLND